VPQLEPPRGLEGRLLAIPATAGVARSGHPVAPWLAVAGLLLLLFGAGQARLGTGESDAPMDTAPKVMLQAGEAGATAPTAVARHQAPSAAAGFGRGQTVAELQALGAVRAPAQVAAARPLPARPAARPPVAAAPAPGASAAPGGAPAPGAGPGPGAQGTPDEPRSRPRRSGTATPQPPPSAEPLPTACVDITVLAFADLAGGANPDCPTCDGRPSPADDAAAAAAGVVLPDWQVTLYDPLNPDTSAATIREAHLTVAGGRGSYHFNSCDFPDLSVHLPVRVQLRLQSADGWSVCPTLGRLEQDVTTAGSTTVLFPMTNGCPVPTPPPSATPGSEPEEPGAAPATAAPTAEDTPAAPAPPGTPDGPQP
jgi:hypothetical protein